MRLIGLASFLLLISVTLPVAAADLPPLDVAFSATRTLKAKGTEASGPYAHAIGNERWAATLDGKVRLLIRRPDLNLSYAIDPARGVGKKASLGNSLIVPTLNDADRARMQELGRESMDGEEVIKYQIVDRKGTITFWVTDDGIPMRILGAGEGRQYDILVTSVSRGPQATELFEIPEGIELVSAN